jgi:hypothetical protein
MLNRTDSLPLEKIETKTKLITKTTAVQHKYQITS